jgi:hypothetical protein
VGQGGLDPAQGPVGAPQGVWGARGLQEGQGHRAEVVEEGHRPVEALQGEGAEGGHPWLGPREALGGIHPEEGPKGGPQAAPLGGPREVQLRAWAVAAEAAAGSLQWEAQGHHSPSWPAYPSASGATNKEFWISL